MGDMQESTHVIPAQWNLPARFEKQKSELLLGIAQITAVILRPHPFCSHVGFLHSNKIRYVVLSVQSDTSTGFLYFLP